MEDTDLIEPMYEQHIKNNEISLPDFIIAVGEKIKQMDNLCDTKTAITLVLHELGIKEIKQTDYVFVECTVGDGTEITIPDDVVDLKTFTYLDDGSVWHIITWLEPVR